MHKYISAIKRARASVWRKKLECCELVVRSEWVWMVHLFLFRYIFELHLLCVFTVYNMVCTYFFVVHCTLSHCECRCWDFILVRVVCELSDYVNTNLYAHRYRSVHTHTLIYKYRYVRICKRNVVNLHLVLVCDSCFKFVSCICALIIKHFTVDLLMVWARGSEWQDQKAVKKTKRYIVIVYPAKWLQHTIDRWEWFMYFIRFVVSFLFSFCI